VDQGEKIIATSRNSKEVSQDGILEYVKLKVKTEEKNKLSIQLTIKEMIIKENG
jgi:hypothetical protein